MIVQSPPRETAAVNEELRDLTAYLAGLPDEIRASGAFEAYEQRSAELSRELILGNVRQFAHELPPQDWARFLRPGITDYAEVQDALSRLAQESQRTADATLFKARTLHWAVLVASAGSLVSIVSPMAALAAPFSALAASFAASLTVWRFAARIKEHERVAERFAALRDEMSHSFGASGEILRTSEHYLASARRFEELLHAIRSEAPERDRPGA